MGEARRRKKLGLPPAPAPAKVRERRLMIPVELDDRLQSLCPPKWGLQEWLVGALEAFATWGEQEKKRQENSTRLVQPYRTVPAKMPAKIAYSEKRYE